MCNSIGKSKETRPPSQPKADHPSDFISQLKIKFLLIHFIDAKKYIIKNFSPPRRYSISNSHPIGSVTRSYKSGTKKNRTKNSMRKVSLLQLLFSVHIFASVRKLYIILRAESHGFSSSRDLNLSKISAFLYASWLDG